MIIYITIKYTFANFIRMGVEIIKNQSHDWQKLWNRQNNLRTCISLNFSHRHLIFNEYFLSGLETSM